MYKWTFILTYFLNPISLLAVNDRLQVFFECPSGCPKTEVMNEIKFVDFINGKDYADVHVKFDVIDISQNMIRADILIFGMDRFKGRNDTLSFVHSNTSPEIELFNTGTKTIKIGLLKYMTNLPDFDKIGILYSDSSKKNISIMDNTDKWNNWTYNTGIRGYFNGQKSYSNNDLNLNVSAERITEENKIVLSGYLNNNESIFYNFESDTAEDGTVNEVDHISQKSHNRLTFKFVHSINEYMGTGIKVKYYSNTYNNIEKSISISPGIEYNFYPYEKATFNRFSILYNITPSYNKYLEETIYFETSETLIQHRIACQLHWMKSWGTVSSNIYFKNYLHDFSQYNYGLHGNVSLNFIHNISIDLFGGGNINHAQITLPNEGATSVEVLLRIQELESQYEYFFGIGFSYTFGSSQVPYFNPRMDDWGW